MIRNLAVLLLAAAPIAASCRTSTQQPAAATGGATSSRTAVESFLAAGRAKDMERMSLVWGTPAGPARATMDRATLEKRQMVMFCFLQHDSHRVIDDAAALNGERRVTVELTQGAATRRTTLTTVQSRDGAWYVQAADLEPLSDFCRQ